MLQRNLKMVGGVYQVGQVMTSGSLLTSCTAYNRNTGHVVGLHIVELPPTVDEAAASGLMQPIEERKQAQSPNVIHVYDWGFDESRLFIITDPPRGITLRQVLDAENIDLARALSLAQQMARGLGVLQARGIVDVDLRPQLITVDTVGAVDRAQLDDIGMRPLLSRLGYAPGQQGEDVGFLDPRYASPEVLQGSRIGPWSDVYQLGLLIYELVAGRLPFVGRTPAETATLQCTSPIPPMSQFMHATPAALQDLVNRALAKDPAQRFLNAASLLAALEMITAQMVSLASITPALTPPAGSLPAVQGKGHTAEMSSFSLPSNFKAAMEDTAIDGDQTLRKPSDTPLESEEGVLAYLMFEQQDGGTRRFPIKNNYVIVGRVDPKRGIRPEVDLTDLDPRMTVSRQHARIRFERTFFYIEDLKSRNKTRLGELILTPLKAELLQHNDVVQIGSVRLVFRIPGMKSGPQLKER